MVTHNIMSIEIRLGNKVRHYIILMKHRHSLMVLKALISMT